MKKKFGFTLAEVLIVITIIGVVAALTLPVLSINVNRRINQTKLKKAYFATVAACKQMLILDDVEDVGDSTLMYYMENNSGELSSYISDFFNVAKNSDGSSSFKTENSGYSWTMDDDTKYNIFVITATGDEDESVKYLGVTIDTDGEDSVSNTAGEDIFSFALKDNCDYYYNSGDSNISNLTGAEDFDNVKNNKWKIIEKNED